MNDTKFRQPYERLTNVDACRLIQVIEVESLVGEGDTNGTPMRTIKEYFTPSGDLLARRDPYLDGELKMGVWSIEEVK